MTSGHWATDQACLGLSWEITEPEATILVTGQKMGSEGSKDNKANGQGKKKKNTPVLPWTNNFAHTASGTTLLPPAL